MVGTGANRTPLTKVHPVLLGKKKGEGSSLLAHHRQQHQERMAAGNQHMDSPTGTPNNQMGGPPHGYQQFRQQSFGNQRQPFGNIQQQQQFRGRSPNMFQNQNMPPQNFNPNMPPPGNWNRPPPTSQGFNQSQPPPPMIRSLPPPPGGNQMVSLRRPQPPLPMGNQPPPLPPMSSQPPPPPMGKQQSQPPPPPPSDGPQKKRKRSRWGAKDDKAVVTGLTTLPADLSDEQRKHYLLQFKIEELTQKLRTGELGIPADPLARSPSPEPIYNSEGKRLNTREFRVRKKLEEDRHGLIKQAIDEIPNFKPPADYKPPVSRMSDKVFIPAEKNPAVNFIGLLIGPRGNTLKRLEKETGCKIIIRGKGSVKEGKVGRIPGQLMPGEDEPLHALITGPSEAEVKKGVEVVRDIIKEGVECPDAANELRRNQLRELAELNGTLIDEQVIKCKNCGATDHRHWECSQQQNITSQITCTKCGGYGHVASDCRVVGDGSGVPQQTFSEKAKMDTEYMSLMAELGVDGPPPVPGAEPPTKKVFQDIPGTPDQVKSTDNVKGVTPASSLPSSKPSISGNDASPFNHRIDARGPRPNGPRSQGPPPWMNHQRGAPPNQMRGGAPPPWQQGPNSRGPPPSSTNNFGTSPRRGPPQNRPPLGGPPLTSYGGAPPTSYPQQLPPQFYNPYQGPGSPWNQPPPPPPPPE